MLKKYKSFLIHVNLSLIIPFFISMIIFMNQHSFVVYKNAKFYEILWYLTCCLPMWISSIIFLLLIKIVPYIIEISSIAIRFLFILLFAWIHEENKKLGMIFDIGFIIVNIIFGLLFLAIKCLQLYA